VASVFADDQALYWTSRDLPSANGSVYKTPLDGGPTQTVASNHRGPGHVVANAACIYWTDIGLVSPSTSGKVLGVRQP
jgi:hypothetical protein